MRVVCTAGHVDHGKSSLVRALTGMEPDRFAEERRRGLTIDLGFAWTDLRDGLTVAFVDLPGHERFIGNMLAGAGPVELALFVVAADEGWMPQSQEHLDILDLLGVSRGLVALTKTDTVPADQVAERSDQARAHLTGTAFAGVDVVPVSARTGAGLDALREALADVLAGAPAPADRGRPRLWVDRSFTIKGAGTVVTGTLGDGTLRAGDELVVLPAGRPVRVRGLQSLNTPVEEARAGVRVAVNVSGVERSQVRRGDALAPAGQVLAVTQVDAWLRALPGLTIGRKGAWHVHAGSGEWLARITPLGAAELTEGFVRVELSAPAPLVAGDRLVLREAGRRATVGGGLALDVDPPAPGARRDLQRRLDQLEARLRAVRADDRIGLLALHADERGAADARRSLAAVGLPAAAAADATRAAGLLTLGPALASRDAAGRWAAAVDETLRDHHRAHPLDRWAPRDVAVRAAVAAGCPSALAPALLDVLSRVGRVAAEGPGLRHPAHRIRLDAAQEAARAALLAALEREPFSPPRLSSAAADAGAPAALVRELEAAGDLVRLGDDLVMTSGAVAAATVKLRDAFAAEGPLTAARAKEVLATTRKYALPLLEHLDRVRVTRRRGDVRDVVG